jgi:predicted AlkP superfamily pyrophosphatase or phosphodiesterase
VSGPCESLIGASTPAIDAFRKRNQLAHITPAFPAVTCTAQSDYVTGTRAGDHGIVGNGWYNRELAEVQFWKQSNHLVQRPKIRDELKRLVPSFTCASKVFAVADHQVAHIYIKDPSLTPAVREVVSKIPGVAAVLGEKEKRAAGIDHSRAGDLIAVAEENAWFTCYYWFDDAVAPDFARTVDIHRKPGYDPVELFLDPALKNPKLKIAWRLLQKKLGFRMLMDVIPLDARLVKGSHGYRPRSKQFGWLVSYLRLSAVDKTIWHRQRLQRRKRPPSDRQ